MDVEAVEEVWHGLSPPYAELFAWGEGTGAQPTPADVPVFRPFMLAHPLEDLRVDLTDYAAEWKWDGIRVQIVHVAGQTRLYSRTGDDVTHAFPDVAQAFDAVGAVDGELLVKGEHQGGTLEDGGGRQLQRAATKAGAQDGVDEDAGGLPRLRPALRYIGGRDRGCPRPPWTERRQRLEAFAAKLDPDRFDVSAVIEAEDFTALEALRATARDAAIEG